MAYDYDAEMARVEGELAVLVEAAWPAFLEKSQFGYQYGKYKIGTRDRAEAIADDIKSLSDKTLGRKIFTLNEIAYGKFWHAVTYWPEMKALVSEETLVRYANLIMWQAQNGYIQGSKQPESRCLFGYEWIVEMYDKGTLKEFISKERLKEAVNRGLWEMINEYAAGGEMSLFATYGKDAEEKFRLLTKYFDYLDLTKAKEYHKNGPIIGGGWVTEEYIAAFKRAEPNLTTYEAAKLAKPIIQLKFAKALDWESVIREMSDGDDVEEQLLGCLETMDDEAKVRGWLKQELVPYDKYIETRPIQSFLKSWVQHYASAITESFGDEGFDAYTSLWICLDYVNSDVDKAKLVSDSLPAIRNADDLGAFADLPLLHVLLTDQKKAELGEQALTCLEGLASKKLFGRQNSSNMALAHLYLADKAIKNGLLSSEKGKNFIETEVTKYVSREKTPSKDIVGLWQRAGEVIKENVSQELYAKFNGRQGQDFSVVEARRLEALRRVDDNKQRERSKWA